MKIFLTGATGFIGSVVAEVLIAAGHAVSGLARSEEAERKLEAAGVSPVAGNLRDTQVLASAAGEADGVIHAGAEMMRHKQGDHNSYKSPDDINKIRWDWKVRHEDVFEYYKDLIALRRAHPGFRMNTWEEINRHVVTSQPRYAVLVNHINGAANGDDWNDRVGGYCGPQFINPG